MPTDDKVKGECGDELTRLNANLARIESLSARLAAALAHKRQIRPSLQGPNPELYQKTAAAFMGQMMANPAKLMEQQITFWGDILRAASEEPDPDTAPDRRFQNPLWQINPYFKAVKAQYQAAEKATRRAIESLDGLDPEDRERAEYFTQQIIDMFAPTNFLATNPEAMARAVETEGQSLVDGLENMVRDLEAHNGELLVSLADMNAFEVGKNIATSDGRVVFKNRMLELIQYAPRTEKVYKTPLIIFPPWINKFYVLDLKEKNSLIRWITDQGFTLFVVSWVNPDASYADVGIDTYIEEGFLTAIDQARKICGVKQVNVTGYCIGGTTLSLTLSLMQKRGDTSVKSATFFTTLTDFSDPGEVGMFLNNDFVDGIAEEVAETGILDSLYMARTFSYLRANDLVYGPAVKSYLLGEAPPAFDLLYWNGDGTNLPGRMAIEYLRMLCQQNRFASDGISILDETLKVSDVKVPLCAIACETDHIAPWKSSYAGIRAMGSKDKTFILSQSGHIAGIVNPPSKKKYGHYTNDIWPETADEWQAGSQFHDGSWWPRWGEWLAGKSGARIAARALDETLPPAPGSYVKAARTK
ncbi:MAG TPA: class I poly(R)-hydroxyalkanoic acid synthase [Aliiroseovarius sp.]|nr:class I poly(R)-hydroxyalkanoic acid synthase [Aliiroseovarius sp.]